MPAEDERRRDREARPPGAPRETSPDQQSLLDRLRDANEQLVVGSMRAQEVADQAEAARTEAEAANVRKDEFFLSVVSHELRTPLNAVLGWAQMLSGGLVEAERAQDAIRTIERNARVMARILDDLLDLSRIIGGGVRIEPVPVDLVGVIQRTLDETHPAAQARGVHVKLTCRGVPDPVAGDAIRLQQVVANLLSNAIKFTPSGGHVEVRLTQVGSDVEIQVSDTGQGIDASFLPHVFERFTQADASTTRRHAGLGLGLAIVRALVERHGGSIRAESPGPGQGATFTVRLPVLTGYLARDAEAAGGPTMRPGPAARMRLDGIRVLLVEDDTDGREVLARMLEVAGARVVAAASVSEALEALTTIRPGVIVSDIGMPDEDGYALIRRLRARQAEAGGAIPAIAVTGYAHPDDRDRLLAAGFQAHLRKPIDPDEIISTVASLAVVGSRLPNR
ncbi:MAG TPA: ATP-binding protein [Methylomirabilota bacterium]|jgi:signal transduction histidine kinase/ActR/RegA family two-component response regulator|nr:ATP-binding protein [Methylomirabilota bacterium]